MSKSILYLHGFASSSNSNKAKVLKKYISKNYKNAEIIIPVENINVTSDLANYEKIKNVITFKKNVNFYDK